MQSLEHPTEQTKRDGGRTDDHERLWLAKRERGRDVLQEDYTRGADITRDLEVITLHVHMGIGCWVVLKPRIEVHCG